MRSQPKERRFEATAPAPAVTAAPTEGKPATADEAQNAFARSKAGRDAAVRSRDDWLARIIELRRAGQDAQADTELARFRAAFPDATIPADALGANLPQKR